MLALNQALAQLRSEGPSRTGARIAKEALHWIALRPGEAILLRVDLTAAGNRLPPLGEKDGLRLAPFEERTLEDLTVALKEVDPEVPHRLRTRLDQKTPGYVAYLNRRAIGFVFYVRGAHDPARIVHPDLRWLGLRPNSEELYVFDGYIHPDNRRIGTPFLRAVQDAQGQAGFRHAYGYVDSDAESTLERYQMAGWREIGRVQEHRFAGRLAVVDGTLYWLNPTSRRPIWSR